jgi:hypothetical protein
MEPDQDVLPESSPGADENLNDASSASDSEPQDLRGKLDSRLDEIEKAKSKPADGAKDAKSPDGDKKKADDAKAQGDKADKAKGDDEKTVPLSALKSRVAEEKAKRVKVQEKLDASEVDKRRMQATIDLLGEELKREREARVNGVKPDPKDDQLRRFELEKRAGEAEQRILDEAKQASEAAAHEAEVEDLAKDLDREIREAVGDESIVSYAEIVADLRKPQNADLSPTQIAEHKKAIRLEALKKQLVKERPNTPNTLRTKNNGAHHGLRIEPTREFLDARLEQIEAQRTQG